MNSGGTEFLSSCLKEKFQLGCEPVGARLWPRPAPDAHAGFEMVARVRYCQAVMLVHRGKPLRLAPADLACPAAASAFGFRKLPDGLASGQGLVGFGICRDAAVGRSMFERMARLEEGWLGAIELAPLAAFPELLDVILIEDQVEKLMWVLLTNVNCGNGARVSAYAAVLQATCVDATLVPFLEKRINFSFGCYGCREATDMEPGEGLVGLPGGMLPDIVVEVNRLAERAIPRSRAKQRYRNMTGKLNREGKDGQQRIESC